MQRAGSAADRSAGGLGWGGLEISNGTILMGF